jgi:hypothetical protein
MVHTDGVALMEKLCRAGWLVDAIASYQPKCRKDSMLQHMQFWTLTVDREAKTAVLTCERDTNDVAITQDIEYTDFPLSKIKIWVELGMANFGRGSEAAMVAMLPSER